MRRPDRLRVAVATAAVGVTTAAAMVVAPGTATAQDTWETLVSGSFQDRDTLQSEWNFLYPWGSDHNGTARMYASATDNNHVYLSPSGVLNLKATRISWDEGNSSADPYLPIRYHSGAVHAKDQILVDDQFPNYEVKGEFQAPSAPGTWPAFWLTGAWGWPPESDILEFKGNNQNWFNTYDGSWQSTIVGVDSPGSWHEYRIWMTKVSDTDVDIHYYLDGQWQAVHRGANFVGQPMWVIINLQMEGSSGASGPTGDTFYQARNVYVGRTRNW